jgi:hypothetical protein
MKQEREIENLVLEQFSDVVNYGFAKPIVKREKWRTTIDWFHDDVIALEVELDWFEFEMFVLIVRLEGGKLPAGYYVSNGKTCRFHLQQVIRERGWLVDQDALAKISPGANYNKESRSTAVFKERLEKFRKVLMSCIEQLAAERDLIFQS